jgi:hypothetical protein
MIDNAVTRFRAGNRQEALARVEATFLGGSDNVSAMAVPAPTPENIAPSADPPAAMVEWIDRCEQLMAKGEQIAGQSNPTDAAEMRQIVKQLREAIAQRSRTDMEDAVSRLEDLVFYLQDA